MKVHSNYNRCNATFKQHDKLGHSTLYTASIPSDRVVGPSTTGSQKPDTEHNMDTCCKHAEVRATMGSVLNQYKVKPEVQVLNAYITRKHAERHRYTYMLSFIVIKLRKIPFLFPSCYYDILVIWASYCQNI
jgi:hypothetical protein